MTDFIQGENRFQSTLFPEVLDDYIAEDNAVRVIDVFVDELDLSGLGFESEPKEMGRPAYHPATLLKLYVYGYMNKVQSSRRLEREAQRNVEVMWLAGRLAPDFKTVADFRKDNGEAIGRVCREFVLLCRKLELFTDAFVAIDGSKFKASNNQDRSFSRERLKRRLERIDASIERYLRSMASADRQEGEAAQAKSERLKEKIKKLKEEIGRLKKIEVELEQAPDGQVSLTDPDARIMVSARGSRVAVGYNVHTAVDATHHLIVAHEVTKVGHDRTQLANMAKQAKDAIGGEELAVVADRGYYRGEEILACDQAGITTYLPRPQTSNNQAKGLFGKRDFRYHPDDDEYECPAGERLIYRFSRTEGGKRIHRYWSSACPRCPIHAQCTTGQYRRVSRWEHEAVLDELQDRVDREPERMKRRQATAEHPFGTIKSWMGASHFLTRTLKRVSTEMSLHVLAYNLKRTIQIMGSDALMAAMRA